MESELYYIKSPYSPSGNCVNWWAVDGHGYTDDLDKAWKVSADEARAIQAEKRKDIAYPVSEIDKRAYRHFDFQNLREVKSIGDK